MYHPLSRWLGDNWRWLLVLSVLPLFADNALYNAPLIIMALLGVGLLIQQRGALLQQRNIRWLLLCFAALWLPQVIALVDAVELGRSLKTALAYPAYMLAAVFIASALDRRELQKLAGGILVVVVIWSADALSGWAGLEAWLGYKAVGMRITGILFNKLTLGHIVAVLSPLVFDYLRRHIRSPWAWLLLIGTVLVVLLSGRRIAWMMLAVAGTGYAVYSIWILRTLRLQTIGLAAILILIVPAVLYTQYQPFQNRIDTTLGLFSADTQTIDRATAHRLDIWNTALSVAKHNPVNGIGPRSFRYVYKDYADAGGYWKHKGDHLGPTHPHQFMLEIAAETGAIGITGYMLFWLALFYALRGTTMAATGPFALAVAIALFPLNAHLALYGSYWTAFVWWLLGILFASTRIFPSPHPDQA